METQYRDTNVTQRYSHTGTRKIRTSYDTDTRTAAIADQLVMSVSQILQNPKFSSDFCLHKLCADKFHFKIQALLSSTS